MRWGDIDWDKSRIIVRSPKTEHHEGKETRTIPIFPEIRTYLERAWDEAPEGAVYVIGRYRNSNANLRTQLKRIIAAAGRKAWPKLFQNLRSTRETELAEDWPIHVVCAWIGNSEAVARNHYLQVTDEHYEKAAQKSTRTAPDSKGNDGQRSLESADSPEKSQGDIPSPPLSFDLAPPVGLVTGAQLPKNLASSTPRAALRAAPESDKGDGWTEWL
jgi:hypothetical protein